MKRLFLYPLLAAICLNSPGIPGQAQSYGERYRPQLFYDRHNAQLDSQALELLKKHLQHLEETNSPDSELLPVMSALALLLRDTPDRKQSIELFKKCLSIREKLGDHSSEEYKAELAGYAEAAFNNDDPQTAEDLISKLIPLAPEYDVKHKLKFALVECYTDQKNYARAEHLLINTIKQNEAVGQCFSSELLGAAEWYAEQKRFDEAKPWYLKAIAKAKQEGDTTGVKKAERALSKFFIKENRPSDVAALLKKSPPRISINDNSAHIELGGDGGVSFGVGFLPDGAIGPEGKAATPIVADWMKEYREALKHLNQKHYLQAEFKFKSGVQKYKTRPEELIFSIGLAKTYQDMKEQQKFRDAVVALVKSQENGGPTTFRPINPDPSAPKDKKPSKESKPL
ncbi:MAG: tetratricopeptide repeat protein [Candidatus Melainabacteria bacterium]|nr:tetratricopeptide repeat protein [Candidatus Melainabacteria bacterium]